MNSKAIKRQLLAAIAMVLVAALALGSSTYAWFVASGTVEAYGMKVTAQSEGGLAISYGGKAWGTSASGGVTQAIRLYPASTKDLTAWSHATAKASDNPSAVQTSRASITDTVFVNGGVPDDNGYVLMREFLIRSTSSENESMSKGLFVEAVSVESAEKYMSTALRVGVRYVDTTNSQNNKSYVYGPVKLTGSGGSTGDLANQASDNYKWYADANDTTGSVVTLATPGKTTSPILADTVTIPATTNAAIKVQVYVWFEGEDANLFSDNFNTEDLSVSVKFSSMGLVGDTATGT